MFLLSLSLCVCAVLLFQITDWAKPGERGEATYIYMYVEMYVEPRHHKKKSLGSSSYGVYCIPRQVIYVSSILFCTCHT